MILKRLVSMLMAALVILATLPVFTPNPAQAWLHPGSVAAPCQQPTDNGCAAAAANGSFKNASLLTSAQQSGQTSLLPTRAGGALTLNIPGVDYGIGPDSTLTPQDPRNINDAICQYNSTDVVVYCHATSNGQVIHETLDNYDFSGTKIGKAPIGLYAYNSPNTPAAGSTLTITNSYFALYPGHGAVGVNTHWSLTAKNNQCDGTTADLTSNFCFTFDTDGVGDAQDIEYNALTNLGVGRVAGGLTNSTFTLKYNYIYGINSLNTGSHGELMLRNCSGARSNCTAFDDYEGNFIVYPCCVTYTGGNGINATIFPGDGASDGVTLTSLTYTNNIIVTNVSAAGGLQPDQALFNSRLASMGTVNISGNWVDATGANNCSISGVKSGGNTVTASSSGNTLTVTGVSGSFGNAPIEPGWLVLHSGFVTATITAYGTGGGGTGTYTFGGATQNVGSDSLWTLVPGYTGTPTLAPNWNLAGSGAPVAMGLNGPQFTATHCSPWY